MSKPHSPDNDLLDTAVQAVIDAPAPRGMGSTVVNQVAAWPETERHRWSVGTRLGLGFATVGLITMTIGIWISLSTSTDTLPGHQLPATAVSPVLKTPADDKDDHSTASSLAGVYRPTYRGVVAERAPVIVASAGKESLPLGAYVPYSQRGSTLHIWDWSKSTKSRVVPNRRLWPNGRFAISPDGQFLAWPSGRLLHLPDLKEQKIDLGGEFYPTKNVLLRRINHIRFSASGRLLLLHINELNAAESSHPLRRQEIVNQGTIQLVTFPAGKPVSQIPAGRLLFALSADEKRIVSVLPAMEMPQQVVEYDATTGKERRRLQPQLRGFAYAMAISPDEKYLAVYDDKGGLLVWDYPAGQLLHSLEEYRRASPSTVLSISPDSKYVAIANMKGVAIVNLSSGKRETLLDQSPIAQIRWSPDGGTLTLVGAHHFYSNRSNQMFNHHLSVTTWDWRQNRKIKDLDTKSPR